MILLCVGGGEELGGALVCVGGTRGGGLLVACGLPSMPLPNPKPLGLLSRTNHPPSPPPRLGSPPSCRP